MVEILFVLFVENSNGELRRTIAIPSSPHNSRIIAIRSFRAICIIYSRNNIEQ
jgi:hypothetical protein